MPRSESVRTLKKEYNAGGERGVSKLEEKERERSPGT